VYPVTRLVTVGLLAGAAKCDVSASSVVEVQPGGKRGGVVRVGDEDLPVGPFGLQRAVEPLDLAVLPRAVRLDELVFSAELAATLVEASADGRIQAVTGI
jgi:hypothetical protein